MNCLGVKYAACLKTEQCACCNAQDSAMSCCSRCKVVRYCSKDCQKKHWAAKHRKDCERQKAERDVWVDSIDPNTEDGRDGTELFITAVRLALGDRTIRDVRYAVTLYQRATNTTTPIPSGHPMAMVHLAIHYEKGIGVKQDYSVAFQWYQKVLQHPHAGEETIHAALTALSKFYREGLGNVRVSNELAFKYESFSQSNPETLEELLGLEQWWVTGGKEAMNNWRNRKLQ